MATAFAIFGLPVSTPLVLLFGIVVSLGLVSALISQWRNQKLNKFMSSMPGPISIPLIGTIYVLLGVKTAEMCKFLLNHCKQYPKLAAHWFLGYPILVTGNLEISNAILASHHNTDKSPDYAVFENAANGVFTYSGQKWRSTRNALTPGLKTNIKGMSFAENYSRHLRTFLEIIDQFSDDGKEHDLLTTIHACVLDICCDNLGEIQIDAQKKHTHLSQLCIQATEMMYERMFNPLLRPDWVYDLTGKQTKFKKISKVGEDIIREVIEQRIKIRNQLKETDPTALRPQTYIEVMLTNVDSGLIPKEEALEALLEFVMSASVPAAGMLTGIFWFLSLFPDVQKKAYQEVIDTCNGDEITLDDLPKLVYLEMVCKEALRHLTVPFIGRQFDKELKVNDKMNIPAGVRVFLGIFSLHHNPEFWEKPGEFYPEHFTEANERKRPRGAFVPFSSGPRNCIGSKHAMHILTILTANTLLHYEVWSNKKAPQDLGEIDYNFYFTILPAGGHAVQLKKRETRGQKACSG